MLSAVRPWRAAVIIRALPPESQTLASCCVRNPLQDYWQRQFFFLFKADLNSCDLRFSPAPAGGAGRFSVLILVSVFITSCFLFFASLGVLSNWFAVACINLLLLGWVKGIYEQVATSSSVDSPVIARVTLVKWRFTYTLGWWDVVLWLGLSARPWHPATTSKQGGWIGTWCL